MLKKSVRGLIPLISVTSSDLIHIEFVLGNMFPDHKLEGLGVRNSSWTFDQDDHVQSILYYSIGADVRHDLNDLYHDAEQNEYTIIFINAEPDSRMMDCGELFPDHPTVYNMLEGELRKDILEESVSYLMGLTVQQIKQVLSLCTVFFSVISVDSIRQTKERLFIAQTGLTKIETSTPYYFETQTDLPEGWIENRKPYMFEDVDHRLVPKGLLMHGRAGTGKTEFAKYVAREWGLSLFLLDVNSMLTKWQGEAEHHLSQALATLDRESPCLVLFDEVEKLFLADSENDTSQRLLSKLLWWLQGKESKVFVVMTCNNLSVLPAELYRAGRIDQTVELQGLHAKDLTLFVTELLKSFGMTAGFSVGVKWCKDRLKNSGTNNSKHVPQADVSQWVVEWLQSESFELGENND